MTKSILLIALPVLSLFADQQPDQMQAPAPVVQAPVDLQRKQPAHVVRTDLQGKYQVENACGVTISGSALYWNAYEDGLDYAIQNTGASTLNNGGDVKRASFDWDWGARADLEYQVPDRRMDLSLSYTYYKTEGSVSSSVTSPVSLFSVWSVPTQAGTAFEFQSNAHAHLTLNMIDLGMSGTFAPLSFLDITPFIDLSTAWIHQKFDFDLSGGPGILGLFVVEDDIDMKNNFWGIGPKFGIDTLWSFGGGFGLCGNFNLSLLYGFFNVAQTETVTFNGAAPITVLDVAENKPHLPRLNFDLFLGLRWDTMFSCNRYHFLLEAGWEGMMFLGQNQLMRFVNQDNSGINLTVNGDLALQGLSVRAAFTF